MGEARFRERDLASDWGAVEVSGEVDLGVAHRLQQALDRASERHDVVAVELEECEFIDSTGIAVLVRAQLRLAKAGKRMLVCAPSRQVRRVMEIAGLLQEGMVFRSLGAALAAERGAG